jgi:predicted nucleic acid-binding protein
MALLDTTVLVDLARGRRSPTHGRATQAVRELLAAGETLFTSRLNEAEFRVGPERAPNRARELEKVERVLAGLAILEFDARAARLYAALKAALFTAGRPAGDVDTLIASIALANGQTLVTRNPRHFAGIAGLTMQPY